MAKIALYHKKKLTENICRGKIFFVSLQSQKKKIILTNKTERIWKEDFTLKKR